MNRSKPRGRLGTFLRSVGWSGAILLAFAAYFSVGAIIALLNGEFSLVLQTFVISALLVAIATYISVRRRRASTG